LRSELATYGDFDGETGRALLQLSNLANRASGDVATEAFYYLGRGYVDWLLSALARGDSRLVRSLYKQLHIDDECCPLAKKCVDSGRLALSEQCRLKLKNSLGRIFARLARSEGPDGAYAELARELQALIESLVVHEESRSPAYYRKIKPLLGLRDPAGTRARLATGLALGDSLESIVAHPPHRAAYVLGRMVAHPCPKVHRALLRSSSAGEIRDLFAGSDCGYKCDELEELPAATVALFRRVVAACPFDSLGFSVPKNSLYFTQHSFVALLSLRVLAKLAKGIPGELADPIIKIHRSRANRILAQISRLRVRLPYPPATKIDGRWITPPVLDGKLSDPSSISLSAPVHVVWSGSTIHVGLLPVAGIQENEVKMLDASRGFRFPGKRASPPLMATERKESLASLLSTARKAAQSLVSESPRSPQSSWVTIYADSEAKLGRMEPLLAKLSTLKTPAVQLAFVTDGRAGAASRALTLRLSKPKGGAKAISLSEWKAPPAKSPGQEGAKRSAPPRNPAPEKKEGVDCLATGWKTLDFKTFLTKLSQLTEHGVCDEIHLLPTGG
jgi:hypothetical protein